MSLKHIRDRIRHETHNIYMYDFSGKKAVRKSKNVALLSAIDESIIETLDLLGGEAELGGFRFLFREFIRKNQFLDQIICFFYNGKILGAVGPITILKDPYGVEFMPPPYFGVCAKFRRSGIGNIIWMQAMRIGADMGAKYILLQARKKSPACEFYQSHRYLLAGKISSHWV